VGKEEFVIFMFTLATAEGGPTTMLGADAAAADAFRFPGYVCRDVRCCSCCCGAVAAGLLLLLLLARREFPLLLLFPPMIRKIGMVAIRFVAIPKSIETNLQLVECTSL
jgi:hypothetical protein